MTFPSVFWLFSRPRGAVFSLLLAGAALRADEPAPANPGPAEGPAGVALPFHVSYPGAGLASIGVYDSHNELVRTLSSAKPVTAGPEALNWDGTTELGLPAAPGAYHVHGVWFPEGPKIDYQMKVGLSGTPPYFTDDDTGGWGGCEGTPQDICTNGKNILAIFERVESPKGTGVQLMDMDGKITARYSTFFPWDGRRACAMDDSNIYVAVSDEEKAHRLVIGKYDFSKRNGKILCDIPTGPNGSVPSGWNKGSWLADVRGMALAGGRLYVPVFFDDKLYVVDTAGGKIVQTADIPSPRGAASHEGKVYLLSGSSLYRITGEGALDGPAIVTGLDDPRGLAIDADGNFYVSVRGAAQQVQVFSPEGKPLREIGVKGGRPRSGAYDPAGMIDPRGLCVTPDGNVWVMSENWDFGETSVWDKAGKRVKSFYNTGISSGMGRLSPDRDEMLLTSYTEGLSAFKIDWKNKSWAPSWFLKVKTDMVAQPDVFASGIGKPAAAFDGVRPYLNFQSDMVKADNGRTYLAGGDFSLWLFDPATKQARLASFICPHRVVKTPDGHYEGGPFQAPSAWLTWADLNGDGKMSLDEVRYGEKPSPYLEQIYEMRNPVVQKDLSILFLGGASFKRNPYIADLWSVYRLAPQKILPSGVPVYDWADLQKVVDLQVPDFKGGEEGGYKNPNVVHLDCLRIANGAIYVNAKPGTTAKLHLPGIDGDGWWASRNWRMTPMKFDMKTGAPAWLKLGHRAAGAARPGEMYYPGWGLAGSSKGVDFYADTLSQVWAWTDDGLFLGGLYHNNIGKAIFDANSIFVELTGAWVYDIDGKTYVMAGDQGVSIHEVTLPALTPLDGGTAQLTPALAAAAKPWDPDGPMPEKRPAYVAHSIYDPDPQVQKDNRTITIDGKLDPAEWDGVPKMELQADGKKVGTVQAVFDKANLYLAYAIDDPNGLKNDGHELPLAPFVTGSYVDFALGPDWTTPGRPDVLDGDVRVILARITGTTPSDYQMGFWPIKQLQRFFDPKLQPKQLAPQDIVSPVQSRHFDDVRPLPGLTFAYQVTERGYTLEARVPFSSLGVNPARQTVMGFDVSAAFSDAGGDERVRAIHWAGESEAAVVDRPGSSELRPQTWGTVIWDRSLLPPPAPAPPVAANP